MKKSQYRICRVSGPSGRSGRGVVLTPLSKDLMEIESKKVESLLLGSYGHEQRVGVGGRVLASQHPAKADAAAAVYAAKERLRNEKKRKIEKEIAQTVSIADDEAKKAKNRSALAAVKKRVQLRQKE